MIYAAILLFNFILPHFYYVIASVFAKVCLQAVVYFPLVSALKLSPAFSATLQQ